MKYEIRKRIDLVDAWKKMEGHVQHEGVPDCLCKNAGRNWKRGLIDRGN